jgi:hypothetical protein
MHMMEKDQCISRVLAQLEPYSELSYDAYCVADKGFSSNTIILERGGAPYVVVKSPIPGEIFGHRHLLAESLTVGTLEEASYLNPAPFEMPTFINAESQKSPYHLALSYVQGSTLSFEDLANVPDKNKVALGQQLAEAVYWIEQHLSLDVVPELANKGYTPNHIMRLEFNKQCITRYDEVAAAGYEPIAEALCATVMRAEEFTPGYLQEAICGHADLFGSNMTFDITPETVALRGIFDFGAACARPTECDFRFFNFISPYYTEGIIERYCELSGRELDQEKMDTWSATQALSPILFRILNKEPLESSYAWQLEHLLKRPELYAI